MIEEVKREELVSILNELIETFGEDMLAETRKCDFEHRGYFKLTYSYLPYNYKIVIENEVRTFDIVIEDEQKASNSLYRIKQYNNILDEKNIIESLYLLKHVLERNNFNLYLHKGNKSYRKMIMMKG